MVPIVFQQMVNTNEENIQQPTSIMRKVKKKKPTTLILEDSMTDSSSDSMTIETAIVEDVPIKRPKRNKHQQQFSHNKITNTKIQNSILK